MRVGIDIRAWARARPTGKGTYTAGLAKALVALGEPVDLVLLKRVARPWPADAPAEARRRLWLGGPLAPLDRLRNRDLSVMHHADSRVNVAHACPAVLTLHDLQEVEAGRASKGPRYRHRVERKLAAFRRARPFVVADSAYALSEIRRHLDLDDGRARVVPLGVDQRFRPGSPPMAALPDRYCLFVGGSRARKNGDRVLAAFAEVARRVQGVALVLTGKDSAAMVAGRDPARFQALGWVDDADMPALFGGASLFLWPSLHEGFGLPVLEAMACGTPVVTSNAAAIPEVAGDAAILVDPTDMAGIASAAEAVLTRPDLAADLRARGLVRAARFTWERTARETLAVYREAIDRTPAGR